MRGLMRGLKYPSKYMTVQISRLPLNPTPSFKGPYGPTGLWIIGWRIPWIGRVEVEPLDVCGYMRTHRHCLVRFVVCRGDTGKNKAVPLLAGRPFRIVYSPG
jgi:hypothetical protein